MTYNPRMVFIETPVFTKLIQVLVDDETYAALQRQLVDDPESGDHIGGRIRKVRIKAKGHGKRGGARVIYFHRVAESQILMLFAFPKNEQEDLTPDQLKALQRIVDTWR